MITIMDKEEPFHALSLIEQKLDGDEIWGCSTCGHERIINWGPPPQHKNQILVFGDFLSARHCCSIAPLWLTEGSADLGLRVGMEKSSGEIPDKTTPRASSCRSCRPSSEE